MSPSSSHVSRFTFGAGAAFVLVAGGAWAATELDALITVQGATGGDRLGVCVAAAGDVDGDGTPDFVTGSAAGDYVLVISGADGSTLHTLTGASGGDQFGAAVAGAGDVDGDGFADIIVGAPQYGGGQGSAGVYSGKDGSQLWEAYGDNGGDTFGSSVAGMGDVDGDSLPDVVVGARKGLNPNVKKSTPGYVKVFLGNGGKPWHHIYGDYSGDEFGSSVSSAGDVDNDGTDDFAGGAALGTDGAGRTPGYVRIFHGSKGSSLQHVLGSNSGDEFGSALAPAGDVDGDGIPDLVVGAVKGAQGSNAVGYARLLSGADVSTIHTMYGDASGDRLGASVAGGGDLDGDGVNDILAGAPGMKDDSGQATGAVRSFSGADGSKLDTIVGANTGDSLGTSVALILDVSGDGIADIVAGIPDDDGAGTDAGATVVVGGSPVKGPTGGVLVNSGEAATRTTSVTLDLAWTAGDAEVTEMRLRNQGGAWGEWTELASTVSWTLASTDGSRTVEAQFRDETALESPAYGDSIVLDTTKPTGSIVVSNGIVWLRSASATLAFTYSDGTGTGVTRMRLRNGTSGPWDPWQMAAAGANWTLTSGAGAKQVQVEFEDAVGNVSNTITANSGVDPNAPTGAISIAGGAALTSSRTVPLTLLATDTGGSGLTEHRLRSAGSSEWSAWTAFSGTVSWDLDSANGVQEVEVQYRDVAGNESAVYVDGIVYDDGDPVIDSVAVHDAMLFYDPATTIGFDVVAHDTAGGSGVQSVRASWDGGATWTAWTAFPSDGLYVPERPELEGAVVVRLAVRDGAFNESTPSEAVTLYFLDVDPRHAGSGGKITGSISAANDIDVYGFDAVEGDVVSVALKVKSGVKKQPFVLSTDLMGPDGTQLVTDRFPSGGKATGIKGFVAPATGRYKLVVRHSGAAGAANGTYTATVGVKAAKTNASGKGTAADAFSFEALAGTTFSGTLTGPGIVSGSVTLVGPAGPVTVSTKVKGTKVTISPVVLTGGSGAYTLQYTAGGPVKFTWKTTRPKAVKLVE